MKKKYDYIAEVLFKEIISKLQTFNVFKYE